MDFSIIFDNLPLLFKGAWLTIQLVFFALLIGSLLAVPIGVAAHSKNVFINAIPRAFIYFFRGTPLLVQLFLIYNGSGQFEWLRESSIWWFFRSAYYCGLLGLTLNTAGYMGEIVRGALAQTSRGEVEAAKAAGMSGFLRFRRIVMPAAFIRLLPAYGNEAIFLLNGSALVSLITLVDLMGAASKINNKYYAPFEAFIAAAVIYFCLNFIVTRIFKLVEKRWYAHLQPREV